MTPKTINFARHTPEPKAVLAKALSKAATLMDLSQKDVGSIIGLSESSIARLGQGGRPLDPKSKEGQLALLFLRLVRSLDTLCGGDDAKIRAWFTAPNSHLHGTPSHLVVKPEGLVHVVDYLDAMRGV